MSIVRRARNTAYGFVAIAAIGCATSSATDTAATIVAPTSDSKAELERAVTAALGGAPVALAEDALTRESVLSVERQQLRDSSGRRLEGRATERPELFHLVKRGERCVLIHERTGGESVLRSIQCVAK